MKKNFYLDIVMFIILLLLINIDITGIYFHEILGIIIAILSIYHIKLNFNWLKNITHKLFESNFNKKTKFMYLLNIILFIFFCLDIGSGILISKNIFFNIITINNMNYISKWHYFFSYWLFFLIVIHIALHWNLIRIKLNIKKGSLKEISIILILSILMLFYVFKNNVLTKMIIPKKESYKIKENNQNNYKENNNEDNSSASKPPLKEYLSKLFCNGCGRHCPLSSPKCNIGKNNQQIKVQEYNQKYNVNESY